MRAVVLGALSDFCRQAKTHITALAVLCHRRRYCTFAFFSFFGSVSFSFTRNKRERNEHIKIILARYSHNIFYVQNM